MTALIGTLNKHGVAIAADSAATIGNGRYDKVYNTANKIFALSKVHPIGIMICGNAEFKGVPWDIIIKSFRKKLGSKCFDTVKDYATNFVNFLKDNELPIHEFKTNTKEINNFAVGVINALLQNVLPPPKSGTMQINITELITKINKEVASLPFQEDYKSLFVNFNKVISNTCTQFANKIIGMPNLQNERETLKTLFAKFIFAHFILKSSSELVLTGYGEKEYFPYILSIQIFQSVDSDWQSVIRLSQGITQQQTSLVCPFAQMDDMATLISGIHPSVETAIKNSAGVILNSLKQDILKLAKGSDFENIIGEINVGSYVNTFIRQYQVSRDREYIAPLIAHIGQLEKEDLAMLAENLIGITSLRKKVTMATESVGGPIDVAVISKHDGFIWMKRKLYFDNSLNPQFRENYYRDLYNTQSNSEIE